MTSFNLVFVHVGVLLRFATVCLGLFVGVRAGFAIVDLRGVAFRL